MPPVLARRAVRATSTFVQVAQVAMVAACTPAPAPAAPPAPPPPAVEVATASPRAIAPASELTGRVEPLHAVEVRPRVSGYVTSVAYREGADVAAGATLFTIDARPYRAALARATAELARAQAHAQLATAEAARAEHLLAANAVSGVERDALVSTAAQAAAEVAAARAQVDLAQLDVDDTRVRAPIAGRTGVARISAGDYVSAVPAPTLLTTLVSTDPVYVYFTGDESTFLRFASHAREAPVEIGLADEAGYPHHGAIDFIDNRLDAATGTIAIRAVVPNQDGRLTPGLYARVRLGEGTPVQAIAIDDKAVLTDQDRKYVLVLGADGTVARKDVKLGRIVDGARVVDSGLAAGDRVIVNGVQKVFPGGKATVAIAAAAAVKP